ncbi:MAG: DUF4321 domain-containing protein [Bacillota bacterium]
MVKGYKASAGNPWLLAALLLAGGIAGSALGESLAAFLPFLKAASRIGFGPAVLDLHFFSLTFGFSLSIGPLTVLGLILGYAAYRRL